MNHSETNSDSHQHLSAALLLLLQEFTVQTEHFIETVGTGKGLHRTDLNALAHLARFDRNGEAATPGKLGQALNLSSPATTALIYRLDRAGHVERRRSETDRRQVQLESTEKAKQTGRALFGPLARHLSLAMQGYSATDLSLISQFISEMTAATQSAEDDVLKPS